MKRFRIRKKRNKFILTVLSVFVALLIWQSIDIVAKYYAAKNNKGVAVASGLYFNSDKLTKKSGPATGLDAITEAEIEKLAVTTNTSSWVSGSVDIPIKIQNYDSNILYNEEGLNISYTIQFKLLDEPVGATYTIKDESGNNTYNLTKENCTCSYSGTLTGGSLVADTYRVQISISGEMSDYKSSRVLVLAYPTAPDYLVNNENQQYRLLGIVEGHPNKMNLEISSAGFLIEERFTNENWEKIVKESVTYIYNFKTKGDIVQDSSSAQKREIKIKWQSDYLSIDRFNEYYLKAIDAEDTTARYGTEQDSNNTWSYLILQVLPYSNINISFYKTDKFNINLSADGAINSQDAFKNLVITEIVTEETK